MNLDKQINDVISEGIIPLDVDSKAYESCIRNMNVCILKKSFKYCEGYNCDNPKNQKCIYHLKFDKWLCPDCLKIIIMYDNLLKGLGINQ